MSSFTIILLALACLTQSTFSICPCMKKLFGVDLRSFAKPIAHESGVFAAAGNPVLIHSLADPGITKPIGHHSNLAFVDFVNGAGSFAGSPCSTGNCPFA